MSQSLYENAKARAEHWLNSNIDDATREQVQKLLLSPDQKLLIDSFYKELEVLFGFYRVSLLTLAIR
ncbi:MAG: hypothetical protein QM734_17805, partial [Cyclobacteriaceae bacterium]